MAFTLGDLLPLALSFALTVALTPVVLALAWRWGAVARPQGDRWHKKPTASLGGIAIFLAVAATYATTMEHTLETLAVVSVSAFLWLLGLVDDLVHLNPYQKLIGQVMGAAVVLQCGLHLPWTPWPLIDSAVTIFWLVGITNAVNLLDNMDGLAGGVAMIGAGFLAVNCLGNGQAQEALLLGVLAVALLGFLVYNWNPASIFMGDCGSQFIGFFLASAALLHPIGGRSRVFLPVLAVPVLVLVIPIFDVTLVTVLRKLSGRAVSQGGRDHTSHRLVGLGMSERRAVGFLFALAIMTGLLALLVRDLPFAASLALIVSVMVMLTLIGVQLAGVKVYDEQEVRAAQAKPPVAFLLELSYKRRVFEVLLDVMLILLAYYAAAAMVFGPRWEVAGKMDCLRVLPIVVCVKMATFLALGVYRGIWHYANFNTLIRYAIAVVLGSAATLGVIFVVYGLGGLPAWLFVIDGLILFVALAGSRLAFRVFLLMPAGWGRVGKRVLIYGAGNKVEILVRELQNNRELRCEPVCFVDDDPHKKDKVMHGLRVFGGNGALASVCEQQAIDEVLISSAGFSRERIDEILRECARAKVTLKRLRVENEPLT